MDLPKPLRPLLDAFAGIFTRPTFERVVELVLCALLLVGRRMITRLWSAGGLLGLGHVSDYHRIFSRAPWSGLAAGRVLAELVLRLIPSDARVTVAIDDTVTERPGEKVYGKGRHRDARRSSHSHVQYLYGHKWVVASVVVELPWLKRPIALPVLTVLYRERAANAQEGLRHKTPAEIARQIMHVLTGWFPQRRFTVVGDGGFSTCAMAAQAAASGGRVHLIGRTGPSMALYRRPLARKPGQPGAPAKRGKRMRSPGKALAHASLRDATVGWYGGAPRRIRFATGVGNWYRSGLGGLVAVRWIYVQDMEGTHRAEWFYTTDFDADPLDIISAYTSRWSIETLFQDARAHLGLEDTRNWCQASVARMVPCIFGFASILVLANHAAAPDERAAPQPQPWYSKAIATFSDIVAAARRWTWDCLIRARAPSAARVHEPLSTVLEFLVQRVCRAA